MIVFRLARPLSPVELRIVGCLIEKELSTPDAYPLSLNALTAAANQRSNRDPVLELDDEAVEGVLERLLPDMLVWRVRTSRVPRWQHNLDAKWPLDAAAKAVLAELLLRGPQTSGELRSRCTRMHSFDDLETVEATLERLAGPAHELVEQQPPRPGQKGARWAHRMGEAGDGEGMSAVAVRRTERPPMRDGLDDRLSRLEERVEGLAQELDELRRRLGA